MEANLLYAALAGFLSAIIMTVLLYLVSIQGKKLDLPYLLGTRFLDVNKKTSVYTLGVTLHLLAGALWGVIYVFLLTAMAVTPNWPAGILWGFGHGIFVGVLMSTLAENHPDIGEGKPIPQPGILGRRWSPYMPHWVLTIHIIYGAVALAIYHNLMQ